MAHEGGQDTREAVLAEYRALVDYGEPAAVAEFVVRLVESRQYWKANAEAANQRVADMIREHSEASQAQPASPGEAERLATALEQLLVEPAHDESLLLPDERMAVRDAATLLRAQAEELTRLRAISDAAQAFVVALIADGHEQGLKQQWDEHLRRIGAAEPVGLASPQEE